jgi:hypothetical protein
VSETRSQNYISGAPVAKSTMKHSPFFETNRESFSGTNVGDDRCSFRIKLFGDQFKNWLAHNLLGRITEELRVCLVPTGNPAVEVLFKIASPNNLTMAASSLRYCDAISALHRPHPKLRSRFIHFRAISKELGSRSIPTKLRSVSPVAASVVPEPIAHSSVCQSVQSVIR